MSNHASVIFTWSSVGDEDRALEGPNRDLHYKIKYGKAFDAIIKELGGHLRHSAWGCSWGEDTSCCECIVLASVNHLDPKEIGPAVKKHAPFLLTHSQQLQVMYKTEDMSEYDEAPTWIERYRLHIEASGGVIIKRNGVDIGKITKINDDGTAIALMNDMTAVVLELMEGRVD